LELYIGMIPTKVSNLLWVSYDHL